MSEVVRLYRYKSLLSNRTAVSADVLMTALKVSRATLRRDISKLRDQLHVSIEFNHELIGDIMRFGADVQVLSPATLRSKVQKCFLEAAAKYV